MSYDEIYKSLSLKDIAVIFYEHLQCIDFGTKCDTCLLNDNKLEGHRVGCLRLQKIAMKKIADIIYAATKETKEVKDGKNN